MDEDNDKLTEMLFKELRETCCLFLEDNFDLDGHYPSDFLLIPVEALICQVYIITRTPQDRVKDGLERIYGRVICNYKGEDGNG